MLYVERYVIVPNTWSLRAELQDKHSEAMEVIDNLHVCSYRNKICGHVLHWLDFRKKKLHRS